MKRFVVLLVAVVAVGACSSSKSSKGPTNTTAASTPTTAGKSPGWNAAALAAGETTRRQGPCEWRQMRRLRAAGLRRSVRLISRSPASRCRARSRRAQSAGGEDLTFETFADQTAAYQFMGTKIRLVCQSAGTKPALASFPTCARPTWFVEPDNKATADKLAPILGGASTTQRSARRNAPLVHTSMMQVQTNWRAFRICFSVLSSSCAEP